MGGNRCRPFGVLDVMILVGFAAVGLAAIRGVMWRDPGAVVSRMIERAASDPSPGRLLDIAMDLWLFVGEPFVACGAVAVVAIRLRRPRPPLRRSIRAPGVLACCWIALGLTIVLTGSIVAKLLLNLAMDRTVGFAKSLQFALFEGLVVGHLASGLAILASWGTAALHRRFRPERCWMDRLGGVVAGVWLVTWPLNLLYLVVYPL